MGLVTETVIRSHSVLVLAGAEVLGIGRTGGRVEASTGGSGGASGASGAGGVGSALFTLISATVTLECAEISIRCETGDSPWRGRDLVRALLLAL